MKKTVPIISSVSGVSAVATDETIEAFETVI